MRHMMLGVGCAAALTGCAQMKVTKVDPQARACDRDEHVKGFRYYLSRPYVLVREKLTISTETALLVFPASALKGESLDSLLTTDARVVGQLNRSGATLDRVSAAEWDRVRAQMAQSASTVLLSRTAALDATGRPTGQPLAVTVPAGAGPVVATTAALDEGDGNAGGGASSPGGGKLPAQPAPTDDGFKTVNLKGAIDVVFLPDFDEQYAVHNKNILSKSSYGMTFRDGWQLVGLNGDFDSTPVAIALLQTIDSAIDTAKTVATTGLDTAAKLAAARKKAEDLVSAAARDENGAVVQAYVVLEVRREKVIRPGLYRINKPWEMGEDAGLPTGSGLLAKLGLPIEEEASVVRAEVVEKP